MLPDRWVAWGRLLGDTIGPVVGNPIAEQVVLGPNPDPNAVPSDLLDVLDADAAWIVDFDIAEAQGMALRLPLTGSSSRGLHAVFVAGVKTIADADGASRIAGLLDAHRHTGGLALVPQGTPTNNTTDAPAGFARGADPLAPLRMALGDPSYTPVAASDTDGDAHRHRRPTTRAGPRARARRASRARSTVGSPAHATRPRWRRSSGRRPGATTSNR